MRLSKQLLIMYKDMHQDMEDAKVMLADLKGQVATIKSASGTTVASEQPVRQLIEPGAGIDFQKVIQENMESTKSMLGDLKALVAALQAPSAEQRSTATAVAAAAGTSVAAADAKDVPATVQQQEEKQALPDEEQASAAALTEESQQDPTAGSAAGQPLCADTCFKVHGLEGALPLVGFAGIHRRHSYGCSKTRSNRLGE